jgi:hypothetical protein
VSATHLVLDDEIANKRISLAEEAKELRAVIPGFALSLSEPRTFGMPMTIAAVRGERDVGSIARGPLT